MDNRWPDLPLAENAQPSLPVLNFISGTYVGQESIQRLELRVDLPERQPGSPYQSLNLVSGDLFSDVGGGEWAYGSSFIVDSPTVDWGAEQVVITGSLTRQGSVDPDPEAYGTPSRETLRMEIPVRPAQESAAAALVEITRWDVQKSTFSCQKTSDFLRAIDLEIDHITGSALPRVFNTHSLPSRPQDLDELNLDIPCAYRRAGIDVRILADQEVFSSEGAGTDLKWDEDELHNAMQYHFSAWRDVPQWKLYLLIATHYRLYPEYVVTGIMYDTQYRDPNDPCPRQGAAAFYASMQEAWHDLPQVEFDRNYLRTTVHELGHALNLLHSFDKGRPDSASWMNYPWRYPYGYNLPSAWDGTEQYWQNCRFEFDPEELVHLRHHALMEVIPGGEGFGALGHDTALPMAAPASEIETAAVGLYVRTRPERYVFQFAEPVTVEIKLKNQTNAPAVVPHMLNPELGLLKLYIRDPRRQVRAYEPLFKLCSQARAVELPPGEKLFESVFLHYGAGGFYFEEPGEYQIWAVYSAGGVRLRSNALRIRVAFPQTADDEKVAIWTYGQDQGHVLYMRGAEHLQAANDQLNEIVERFSSTALARYINYCFGNSYARQFKDVITGQVRPPEPQRAVRQLARASTLLRETQVSALDNITHGQAVDLLYNLYRQMGQISRAKSLLTRTARYFQRMEVKQSVIDDLKQKTDSLEADTGQEL
jgi:hypothetical protein